LQPKDKLKDMQNDSGDTTSTWNGADLRTLAGEQNGYTSVQINAKFWYQK